MIDFMWFNGYDREGQLAKWSEGRKREDIISVVHTKNEKNEDEIVVYYWVAE